MCLNTNTKLLDTSIFYKHKCSEIYELLCIQVKLATLFHWESDSQLRGKI